MRAVLEELAARAARLAEVYRALDDPWLAALHSSGGVEAADDERSAKLFARSGMALTGTGRLIVTLIRWAWAAEDDREGIEADIAAWATQIRAADGSWPLGFVDAPPRYRWRAPFTDSGTRWLDEWLNTVVGDGLPAGPEPPAYEDPPAAASSQDDDPTETRAALLQILEERLDRAAVWPDPVPLSRATRTRDALLAASNSIEVASVWALGEGLLMIDDSWNAALCGALLAPIEALSYDRADAAVEVRDKLLGPGAGSTAFAASVLHERFEPNFADSDRAAGARLGEAGFPALAALRYVEVPPDAALLRPTSGESMVRRWNEDCPIDSSPWANVPEPGVIR